MHLPTQQIWLLCLFRVNLFTSKTKICLYNFYSCPASLQNPHNSARGLDVIHSCATAKLLRIIPTNIRAIRTDSVQISRIQVLHSALWSRPQKILLVPPGLKNLTNLTKHYFKILTSLKVMCFSTYFSQTWIYEDIN